jgi:hypothetical protein
LAIAASHRHLFQPLVSDENEIHKLVASHFLLDRTGLQLRHVIGEDIMTPNTKEIVVFASFFQCWFGIPVCCFLHGLLDHYQIELVHLNPNSILQIIVFIHLYEVFLGILPNFPLFKNYFFLKYQPSAANQKMAIKRMEVAQSFEDKVKEVGELNLILYARNQELEAKLAEESHAKDGKVP